MSWMLVFKYGLKRKIKRLGSNIISLDLGGSFTA
jgi:hypothetical protein